jgi:hypothetical protein
MATGILGERAIKSAGGAETLKQKNERYYNSVLFIEEHKEELVKKFNEQWIAVYNSKVVANNSDFRQLMRVVGKKDIPQDEMLVQYLTSEDILTLYTR